MKKIEQIFESIDDSEKVIAALGELDVLTVNKYWGSSKLQDPDDPEDREGADIQRLLLIAFAPSDSIPAKQRGASRLRTCRDYNNAFKSYRDQEHYEPGGVLTMSTAYQRIPLQYFEPLYKQLGIVKVRIPASAYPTHFSEGNIDWLKGVRQIEVTGNKKSEKLLSLPRDIGHLIELESIKINDTVISELPDSFFDLSNLVHVDLGNNAIQTLQNEFLRLDKLAYLDVSGNRLESIPDSVGRHPSIKSYRIYGNPLREISDELAFHTYRINMAWESEEEFPVPVTYPKDILVVNETWLNISPARISEIIEKSGVCKLRIESREMLELILLPEVSKMFSAIKSLDLSWREWSEYRYMKGYVQDVCSTTLNPDNEKSKLQSLPKGILYLPQLEELDLSGNGITELPEELFQLTSLRKLNLRGTMIEQLPDRFDSFIDLEILDLSNTPLVRIPDSVFRRLKLKELYLNAIRQIYILNDAIGNLESLKRLEINFSGFSSFPATVKQLKNLEILRLYNLRVDDLMNDITELRKLKVLSIVGGHISEIPASVSQLEELEELDLSDNAFEEIPASIGGLKKLKKLILQNSSLVEIVDNIGECENLLVLDLENSEQLSQLPLAIGNLTRLEYLKLRSCTALEDLPDVFHKLESLQRLDLNEANVSELPESLYKCISLRELDLFGTSIDSIDSSISNLKSLEKLNLGMTDISKLPDSIGTLNRLKILQLPELSEPLPDSISSLKRLEELEVRFKAVPNPIPETISELTALKRLHIRPRGATSLPVSLKLLNELESLYIGDSDVESIPEELFQMNNLLYLEIPNNKIKALPIEIFELKNLKHFSYHGNPALKSPLIKKRLMYYLPGAIIQN
jgi:Leucine-rich repeat (LRR) protein